MSQPSPGENPPPLPAEQQSGPPFWPGLAPTSGLHLDATVGPATGTRDTGPRDPSPRQLTRADFESHPGRRIFLPVFLFLASCASTFIAGSLNWNPAEYIQTNQIGEVMARNWQQGLIYMAAVIGILLTHEMGHFVQTIRYHVPASLPYFIPMPMMPTGTMGAVIGMEGSRADRKQLFDIGISGPWAGLIVSLPIIWFGIKSATVVRFSSRRSADLQTDGPLVASRSARRRGVGQE